jgi:hypothetical protein
VKWQLVTAVAGLLISIGLAVVLGVFYQNGKKALYHAAQHLRAIGDQYIDDTIIVRDTIDLEDLAIAIRNPVDAHIKTLLDDSAAITTAVRYDTTIPIHITVDTILHLDTTIRLPFAVPVVATGDLVLKDQKLQLFKKIGVKVGGTIRLDNLALRAKLDSLISFVGDVHVHRLNVDKPVSLHLIIPIDQQIKFKYQIDNDVGVVFKKRLQISGRIPVRLVVPVHIALSRTPLKTYLDSTAGELDKVFPY